MNETAIAATNFLDWISTPGLKTVAVHSFLYGIGVGLLLAAGVNYLYKFWIRWGKLKLAAKREERKERKEEKKERRREAKRRLASREKREEKINKQFHGLLDHGIDYLHTMGETLSDGVQKPIEECTKRAELTFDVCCELQKIIDEFKRLRKEDPYFQKFLDARGYDNVLKACKAVADNEARRIS